MSSEKKTILLVDDEPDILESLRLTFEEDYDVLTAASGKEGLDLLRREQVAVIIVDQRMPEMVGTAFLEQAVELAPRAIRIMLTGYSDMEALIEAVNTGHIYRYIAKPWSPDALKMDVLRAVERYEMTEELDRRYEEILRLNSELEEARQKLEQENVQLRQAAQERYRFEGVIGQSPSMERVYDLIEKVLDSDASVLLSGETGTGKELLARCIHFNGLRRDGPFVAQNCAALPSDLLESELYGHRKGAFTGAVEDRPGLFETADGGTVFLDEIGEMSPAMQVRLLRVLQDGEIRRVGENAVRKVDVRILAATNRDLKADVEVGRFREDLFFRLNVFPIDIPPLRRRREDIPSLVDRFLNDYAPDRQVRMAPEAMDLLCRYDWPGNVRELQNEVQRALLLAEGSNRIGQDSLSEDIRGASAGADPPPGTVKRAVEELEKEMIAAALGRCKGNRTHAAKELGLSRYGLLKKIERYEIGSKKRAEKH
ncbi:MAG: sigma-54 dependent transcriptional regulator [Candidatus Latescibacteria bacterium]|nr:sigma-54 dependent transcriptional regulator [Candidatus Latescibacterota bacterium]